MKIYKYVIIGLCSLTAGTGFAQDITQGGKLMAMTDFQIFDMLDLSRTNYAYGTARSAAMGGAFGSLGGDLASIGINPAGLGMYRSSEFGISFGLGFNQLGQTYSAGPLAVRDNSQTRFALNNLSVALNTYQGTGALTSFSLGFGYNKVADFNSRSTITMPRTTTSIAQMFMHQLNNAGLRHVDIFTDSRPFNNTAIDPFVWGGILGFQTGLINSTLDGTGLEPGDPQFDNNREYHILGIQDGITGVTEIDPVLRSTRKGSIGEYSISGGFNFNNKLYLGLSMGIQDIYLSQKEEYTEWFNNPSTLPEYGDYLNNMYYAQELRMSGTGVNFKFGAIYRPIDALRIGVAVHTPTWISIDREYKAYMYTEFNAPSAAGDKWQERSTSLLTYQWDFQTPTRLMGGVSYMFGNWGVLSADYERAWYNGIRLNGENQQISDALKNDVKNTFRATNNLRIGAEFKPLPELSLRAGYAFYQSPIQKTLPTYNSTTGQIDDMPGDDAVFDAVAMQRTSNISAGIGYRFGNASLDLAYTHSDSKMSSYDLYYYNDGANEVAQDGYITPRLKSNLITLSFGVRF